MGVSFVQWLYSRFTCWLSWIKTHSNNQTNISQYYGVKSETHAIQYHPRMSISEKLQPQKYDPDARFNMDPSALYVLPKCLCIFFEYIRGLVCLYIECIFQLHHDAAQLQTKLQRRFDIYTLHACLFRGADKKRWSHYSERTFTLTHPHYTSYFSSRSFKFLYRLSPYLHSVCTQMCCGRNRPHTHWTTLVFPVEFEYIRRCPKGIRLHSSKWESTRRVRKYIYLSLQRDVLCWFQSHVFVRYNTSPVEHIHTWSSLYEKALPKGYFAEFA